MGFEVFEGWSREPPRRSALARRGRSEVCRTKESWGKERSIKLPAQEAPWGPKKPDSQGVLAVRPEGAPVSSPRRRSLDSQHDPVRDAESRRVCGARILEDGLEREHCRIPEATVFSSFPGSRWRRG